MATTGGVVSSRHCSSNAGTLVREEFRYCLEILRHCKHAFCTSCGAFIAVDLPTLSCAPAATPCEHWSNRSLAGQWVRHSPGALRVERYALMHSIVVSVRSTCASDLQRIARLHHAQFGDHLLGCLPEPLLIEFYRALSVDTIFLVAEIDGSIEGFVLGGEDAVLHRNRRVFMRSNRWRIMGAVIVHPSLWPHVWKRASALRRPIGNASRFSSAATTRLLSIAVSEGSKGQGVAKTLIQAFEASLNPDVHYGFSVNASNKRAIGFYQKCGFVEEGRRGGSVFYLRPPRGAPISATAIGFSELDTAPPDACSGLGTPG